MTTSGSYSRGLFWIITVMMGLFLSVRAMRFLPIFLNADLRTRLSASLQEVAAKNGWLLSDLHFGCADSEPRFWVVYQVDHQRFTVPEEDIIPYPYAELDRTLPPCAE